MSTARILLDSISPRGDRLTTFELVLHRFVLAEFNTHRVFSRNSASSRAVPTYKTIHKVRASPALPFKYPKKQKGMQGGADLPKEIQEQCEEALRNFALVSCELAEKLDALGLHKSVVNRYLEPFMWHTIIVSSTEWLNFFNQRCSNLAQPEIRVVAEMMQEALERSSPQEIENGEWHTPLILPDETDSFFEKEAAYLSMNGNMLKRMVSAARCARVSYLTHDGRRDLSADIALYEKLVSAEPPHWSPLEHVATPLNLDIQVGNFTGWRQLRHTTVKPKPESWFSQC